MKDFKINREKLKKILCGIIILFICLLCIGYFIKNVPTKNHKKSVIDSIKNLDSYKSKVNIMVKNNKQEILYCGEQFYKASIGSKLNLEKNIYLLKDGELYIKDYQGRSYKNYKEDLIYKFTFIEEYLKYIYLDNKLDHKESTYDGKSCEVLSFELIGNNDNMYKAKMYFERETAIPLEIKIFNKSGKETVNIKYDDFLKNVKIDEKEFKI